jgi:Putative peptidoglycan binding domain
MSRFVTKAGALVTAWQQRYDGGLPTKHAALLVCSVAEHETRCGDSWPGEHNWGAIQRRTMTEAERAVVRAGGVPEPRDAFEALHGDSSPINGRYQVWFWRFPNDVEGANKLLEVLLDKRPSVQKDIDRLSTDDLARRMYLTRYYEGFHDPRPRPGEQVPTGGLTQGQRANIADYAKALARHFAFFRAGLIAWQPGVADDTPTDVDLFLVSGYQAALRQLGFDPGPIDGIAGPRTRAAVEAFQRAEGLAVDSIVGPQTRARLRERLRETLPPPTVP